MYIKLSNLLRTSLNNVREESRGTSLNQVSHAQKDCLKKYRNLQHFLKLDRNNCHGPWFVVLQISHFEDAHYCLVISTYFNAWTNTFQITIILGREDLNECETINSWHSWPFSHSEEPLPQLPYASLCFPCACWSSVWRRHRWRFEPTGGCEGSRRSSPAPSGLQRYQQPRARLVARLVNRPEEPVVEPASTWGSNSSDGIFECFWIIFIPVNEAPSWLYKHLEPSTSGLYIYNYIIYI